MADEIKVYQKPTCSKCRETIGILREEGVSFESINYYERPLGADQLRSLIAKLGLSPRDLLRKGEKVYKELEIGSRELTDDQIIELMVEHPDLLQRPIVVRGEKAVLGRPPENVKELL
ncbi:MAG TPA: arsenate reductase (glutaredoxin) [Blastocatellia bacterium]|nr:arsenate reductase (glutaredoxin) [Blastocatellia bacterium]